MLDDPHYLHGKSGLSLVVRPPVRGAAELSWTGDGWLVVATRVGQLLLAHPVLGTRLLSDREVPVLGLGTWEDRVVTFTQDGAWRLLDTQGRELHSGTHPFVDRVQVQFHEQRVVVTGATSRDRQTLFYEDGRKVFRVRLPPRAVAFVDTQGKVGLAQATQSGLEVVRMQPGARFSSDPLLPHDLEVAGDHVVGVTGRGACVWSVTTQDVIQVPLDGTTAAALSADARWLGLGTFSGGVALVDLTAPRTDAPPPLVQASEQPITDVAFAPRGRWMASAADDLILWTWDAAPA